MKNILLATLLIAACLTGCKETDSQINMANNKLMRDSVFKVMPYIRQIEIAIYESSRVEIKCGSKELFNADKDIKQAAADELAKITYHFYNKNNYLSKGTVIITPIEDRLFNDNDPKEEYDMHLKELVKANEK